MLLPEIVHLPAVLLLAMVVVSGIALPTAVPFAVSAANASPGQVGLALGAIVGAVVTNLAAWFSFLAARRATPTTRFLGFTNRIWSLGIPLAYVAGLGFGIYLCILFYV